MSKISHCLWFDGKAEEAAKFYTSIFKDGKIGKINHYGKAGQEQHGQKEGAVMTVEFEINGMNYLGLNAGPIFKFNEAFSIVVTCEDQKEVDYYWEKLTSGGGQEVACGWLKDKFGLSWQITPKVLEEMMRDPDQRKVDRVMQAFMKMKKYDIAKLVQAYEGK